MNLVMGDLSQSKNPEGRFIGERIDENDLPLTDDHIILKK